MIAEQTHQRPARRAPIDSPQPFIKAWILVSYPRQVRRRGKHTQPTILFKREIAFERSIKLAGGIVARPDGVLIHAYRHDIASEAHYYPRPSPPQRVVGDLPWAYATDHREHQRSARLEQTCTRT